MISTSLFYFQLLLSPICLAYRIMESRPRLTRRQLVRVYREALAARHDPRFQGKSRRAVALFAVANSMNWFVRAIRHFLLVCRHKFWVFVYCAYSGHVWRGLAHDWSKYSPSEFFESVRYFNGRRSPVGLCRELNGYSYAWLRHKGRNRHHFEFWTDLVDGNTDSSCHNGQWFSIPMPFEYALESVCDTIAASRAYNGPNFSYDVLYRWWVRRSQFALNMHPETRRFVDAMYREMHDDGNCSALRRAKEIFDRETKDV